MDHTKDVPQHVAVIMDGNGRWAKERGLLRTQGHLEGVKRVDEIVEAASGMGIKVLTLYTFSTENWTRPEDEVSMLMQTLVAALDQKMRKLHENGVRFRVCGSRSGAPGSVLSSFDKAVEYTKNNTGLILNIAFNYGGRQEILEAVRGVAEKVQQGSLSPAAITEDVFCEHLYTRGLPDPDLLIRTSGELRISNFLLWQLSYAEFYFTEKYWPDFTPLEFDKAIQNYRGRDRRFGRVGTGQKGKL